MPNRRSQPPEPQRRPRLRNSREEAAKLLEARIALGEELVGRMNPAQPYVAGSLKQFQAEYYSWSDYNEELLRSLFDTGEVADDYDPHFNFA